MDKAPDAYRTISEVADDLDLPQHVLRFWETRFSQIKPLKRGGGRRYYRPDDVELLKGIRHLLYKEGYTIKGVQRILKEQGARAVQVFARGLAEAESAPLPPPPVEATPPAPPAPAVIQRPATTLEMPVEIQVFAPPPPPAPPVLVPAIEAAAAPPVPDAPNPALENWRPEPEEEPADSGIAITLEQGPAPPPPPQVSMFRGGLARGEGVMPAPPPARPAFPVERDSAPEGISASAREAMRYALDELVACRSMIDRVLARRQPV
ncbi:MerR family transcriptional regulator [Rhabdaerophilum sp. SD176]|uniref:MerR family transcriptional regulator n=1 Tax=Rhabdaerophilum sp. SD176 TaxID=2983548 RepID=UPI0024E02C9D|nr:MerR family transcriptional regulator [Rhabdaerophilum sp. SD176]